MSGRPDIHHIIFQPQEFIDDKKIPRQGERFQLRTGETGYVDWSGDNLLEGSPGTARMMRPDHINDIEVSGEKRQGMGRQLITTLTARLAEKGYRHMVILGATLQATGFYDKTLDELRQNGIVEDISKRWRTNDGYTDVNYVVRLKPNS